MARVDDTADRKEAILEAALACFAEKGWEATGLDDIRRSAGASIGSVYHHFGSKEGIARALYDRCLEHYRSALRARLERTRSARTFVRAVVEHHLMWSLEEPVRARFLVSMRGAPGVAEGEDARRASTSELLREVGRRVARFVEAGELRKLPPALWQPVVVGPAQELVRQWAAGRARIELRDAVAPLSEAAWRAVRAEE